MQFKATQRLRLGVGEMNDTLKNNLGTMQRIVIIDSGINKSHDVFREMKISSYELLKVANEQVTLVATLSNS